MRFEIQLRVYGNLRISNDSIEIKKHPYIIKLFKDSASKQYISISKPITQGSDCLPTANFSGPNKEIKLPPESAYSDMLEFINHIESFGALDNKFDHVDRLNLTLKWISENDEDHFSPLEIIERKRIVERDLELITEDWLMSAVLHKNQLGDLYIPFSFFRDGKTLFNSLRYQAAFCTFYMMLEYFFHEKNWGIMNDAFKRKKCLNSSLNKTLDMLKKYKEHHGWLANEIKKRGKQYDEAGLLFVINMYRNELSHAVDKDKNRNLFVEQKFFSLAYITMMICVYVSIKKRLLPFIRRTERDNFLRS